ncbi:uncharacterized ABC transporter ATP-binding protein YbhF [Arthrobacter sp. Hiyo8]|nr:uncharacterized ABC transporter ATP-binding protein YbhF [Arthrobacter sp. Hiyo8]
MVKPKSGQLLVDGIDVQQEPLDAKARLGVQLQSSSFQAELTIQQIARLYGGLYGVKLSREQIGTSMRAIGLEQELGKRFKQLSGGQQQRLALFIATIHNPSFCCSTSQLPGWTRSRAVGYGAESKNFVEKATAFSSPPTPWKKRRPCVTG